MTKLSHAITFWISITAASSCGGSAGSNGDETSDGGGGGAPVGGRGGGSQGGAGQSGTPKGTGGASGGVSAPHGAGAGGAGTGSEDCAIAEGTKFRVKVLAETSGSSRCHIATVANEFEITAGTPSPIDCTTPATWAPEQQGVEIITCRPAARQMLGAECTMKYPSTCEGLIDFSFYEPAGAHVDWAAPIVEGAIFRIRDTHLGCIPNISNCLDEYAVVLERLP